MCFVPSNIKISLSWPLFLTSSNLKSSGGIPAREAKYRPLAFMLIFHHFLIIITQHSLSFPHSWNCSFFPLVSSYKWNIFSPVPVPSHFQNPSHFFKQASFQKLHLILSFFIALATSGRSVLKPPSDLEQGVPEWTCCGCVFKAGVFCGDVCHLSPSNMSVLLRLNTAIAHIYFISLMWVTPAWRSSARHSQKALSEVYLWHDLWAGVTLGSQKGRHCPVTAVNSQRRGALSTLRQTRPLSLKRIKLFHHVGNEKAVITSN